MAPTQPYLYPPTRTQYSLVDPFNEEFDPKAYTRASWASPSSPDSKQDGHKFNFNRHPDSYLFLPYGQTDATPMPANTKQKVKVIRWIQLGFRVIQMLGALGMLVCVICIKNTTGPQSYIVRVPAAADILSTAYAIYHLCRNAKSRPPTSSASYHFFSLIIDITLIPFYIFTALLAKSMQNTSVDDQGRWKTFFNSNGTNDILLTTWLVSIVEGSLHLITAVISVYLVYIFREIANLPPDMNPLEDNLTSRRTKKYKHKHKNSELNTSIISEPTLISSSRSMPKSGQSSPTKEMASLDSRPISFLHTRTNSGQLYSPHNPLTAEASRSNPVLSNIPSIYQHPHLARNSRIDSNDQHLAQDGRSDSPTKYSHRFMSEPSTYEPSVSASSSVYVPSTASTLNTSRTPPLPRKSSRRHALLSDNWFVHEDHDQPTQLDTHLEAMHAGPGVSIVEEDNREDAVTDLGHDEYANMIRSSAAPQVINFGAFSSIGRTNRPVYQHSSTSAAMNSAARPPPPPEPTHYERDDGFTLAPLHMNPPTPPPTSASPNRNRQMVVSSNKPLPLGTTSGNGGASTHANTTSKMPSKSPADTPKKSVGTPTKVKYYGDLNSAMAGVRGLSPSPGGNATSTLDGGRARGSPERTDWAIQDGGRKGRVVSRSGIYAGSEDLSDVTGTAGLGAGLRSRNVSGKVAEEGRGGTNWKIWGR